MEKNLHDAMIKSRYVVEKVDEMINLSRRAKVDPEVYAKISASICKCLSVVTEVQICLNDAADFVDRAEGESRP